MKDRTTWQIAIIILIVGLIFGVVASTAYVSPSVRYAQMRRPKKTKEESDECKSCVGVVFAQDVIREEKPDGTYLIDDGTTKIYIVKPDPSRPTIPDEMPRVQFFYRSSGCMACTLMKPVWDEYERTLGSGLITYDKIDCVKIANTRDIDDSDVSAVPLVVFKKNRADKGTKYMGVRSPEKITEFVKEQMRLHHLHPLVPHQ